MKLVIVGGSAASTPNLFLAPALCELLPHLSVTLVGTSVERLDAVRRALRVLLPELAVDTARCEGAELCGALDGANAIVIQARYGGLQARAHDETFPLRFGIPGDEGLGPGGLSAAWRAWPQLEQLLENICNFASSARIIALTAPLGILTRNVLSEFPRLHWHAVCELPYATLQEIAKRCDVPLEELKYNYIGVNHLGWFDTVTDSRTGRDAIDTYAQTLNAEAFPPRSLVAETHAIPLKYERLAFDPRAVVAEQQRNVRAETLRSVQHGALRAFATGSEGDIEAQLQRRQTPWYSLAVAPLIATFAGRTTCGDVFITTRNDGYIASFESGDIIEIPFAMQGGKLDRIERTNPPPPFLLSRIKRLIEYEKAAAHAVRSRDKTLLAEALRLHPWVDPNDAPDLASAVVYDPAPAVL